MKGVPEGPRKRAFQAFIRELQDSPLLRNNRVVKTWKAFDGESFPATTDQMPAVQLRMIGGEVRRLTTRGIRGVASYSIEARPSVVLELWTRGPDQGDAQDVGDLICAALFPADPAQRAALDGRLLAAGIVDVHQATDLLPRAVEDFTKASIASVALFTLTLHLAS